MSDIFFVLKSFFIAVVIVLLLQIKVGESTLEQQTYSWMQQSSGIQYLRQVADGAIQGLRVSLENISASLDTRFSSVFNRKEELKNRLQLELKRSDEYYHHQIEKIKSKKDESVQE